MLEFMGKHVLLNQSKKPKHKEIHTSHGNPILGE